MSITEKYRSVLDEFVKEVTVDSNILAIILAGGLHHNYLNGSSDINLIIVVQDDKIQNYSYTCLYEEIVFNIDVFQRTQIIRNLSSQTGDYYRYSYLSDNEIIFSRDEALKEILSQVREVKKNYLDEIIIISVSEVLFHIREIKKWLDIKGETTYAQYHFIKITESMTKIEHALNKKTFSLTPIPDAYSMNKEIFQVLYKEALTQKWSLDRCYEVIGIINEYIESLIEYIEKPIIRLFKILDKDTITLNELGEHFHAYPPFLFLVCQLLSEKGSIVQVTVPMKVTKTSKVQVEQIAYFYNF